MFTNIDGSFSKTKVGASLVALAALLGTIGTYLGGGLDLGTAIQHAVIEVGALISVLGLRDAITKPKVK